MVCLSYTYPDSFGCDDIRFHARVDIACLVSPPTSKADLGRLKGKHQPSAALLARHDGSGGDTSSPSPSLVIPKPDLGKLTAKKQCSVIPSAALSARHDNIGSDASSLSSSTASFQYISHAWSRNVGFVCGCTQTEDVLTPAQSAGLAFQNREKLNVIEVNLSSENHVSGMSPSEHTASSGSSILNEAFEAQAGGITEDTQSIESPFCSTKPSTDQSHKASMAATSRSQQSLPFLSNTEESQHIRIEPWEQIPSSESPASTPGLANIDSGSMLSEVVILETKNVNGSEIRPSQAIQEAQVRGFDPYLDSFPWQGNEMGSYFHARMQDTEMGVEEDQGHFEPVNQHSSENEADGSSYVASNYPDSWRVMKEMNSAREEQSNDTDYISVVRLPAYRTSYPNWSSKFTESIFYLESMGVDTGKLVREEPTAVTYDIMRLRELVRALEDLGLHWNNLGKIFNICPRIIHLSPDKDLKLVTDFLFAEAGLSPKDFGKVIKRCPRLLACNVVDQLLPTLMFLRTLGFSNMGQVIANNATLLSLNVEKNLLPKMKYLESLGFTHREVVSMVVRFPALFNYKVKDNLEPKYEYLVHEMGGSNRDLLAFPQYFGYSLANRIIPRHQCIAKQSVSLSIQAMLKLSEAEFYARFHCICEQGPSSKLETSDAKVCNCAPESAKFVRFTYPKTTPILVSAQR